MLYLLVDKAISTNIKRRVSSRPRWDQKLRKALINSKGLPDTDYNYDAHHIVAKGARRAKDAVDILFALGIDVDDPDNRVFLPKDEVSKKKGAYKDAYIHGLIHTKPYYANINYQVVTAYGNGAETRYIVNVLNVLDVMYKERSKYKIYSDGNIGMCEHAYINEPSVESKIYKVSGFLGCTFVNDVFVMLVKGRQFTGLLIREYKNP